MATSDIFYTEHENNFPDCRTCKVASCSIFNQSNKSQDFNPPKKLVHIKSGEYLFKENDISEGVFCVLEGTLLVQKKGSAPKEQILAVAEPGEILGISSILNHNIYTTSLFAVTDVKACFYTRENFLEMIRVNPGLGIATLSRLGSKINLLESRI